MMLATHSGDVPMDRNSDNQVYSPRMMLEETGPPSNMTEDIAPIASTSKIAYEPSQSSEAAPLASTATQDQASNTSHAHDQDINVPSLHNPTMQEPALTSTGAANSLSSILKGKGRASDSSLPIEAPPKQSLHPIMLPDPFQSSEMERLKVENYLLKKQLDVLARKKFASNSLADSAPNIRAANSLELEHVNRMLRTSEAQRKRLEKELRYLRSYLLSSVEPYRLPTPESESEEHEDMNAGSDSSEDAVREDVTGGEDGAEPRKRRRRRSGIDNGRLPQHRRKQTMGDAETEHLLLASARLSRLRKVVDVHPHSELSHLPQARQSRVSFPLHSNNPSGSALHQMTRRGEQQDRPPPLPPLPPPAWREHEQRQEEEETVSLPLASSSAAPSRLPPAALYNVLGSPIRTKRIKIEQESRRVTLSNAASIFRSSAAAASASNANNQPLAPIMQPSTSTTSSGRGERKIGRPLGSPNKTKLVSINNTAAVRKRNKATDVAGSNGGRARGASRAAGPSVPSSSHPRGRSQTQDPTASVDELLLAAQSLYGNDGDVEMQMDDEDYREWQDQTSEYHPDNGWRSPEKKRYDDPSPPKAVPWPPATPASLQHPDMTRFPNQIPEPSTSGLPATPGRPRTVSNGSTSAMLPPQTPNTIARNERSALDVLAEEAASASKGPATLSAARNLDTLSGSARNLAQEMEMARRSPEVSTGFEGGELVNTYDAYYSAIPESAQDPRNFLGAAFSPHLQQQQQSSSDPVEEGEHGQQHDDTYEGPMTIADQLAQGVDISHPLIDQEDIQAGMTPAAAFAKRTRSPYVKWLLEEDELLVQGVAEHGTKWEAVARMVPSRSYHQCRQRWLRGLKSGEALPPSMQHLKPKIDAAVQAYEQARPGAVKKVEP